MLENTKGAIRRNEDLRRLDETQKERSRSQEIIDGGRRLEELRDARLRDKIEREKLDGKSEDGGR